jgi:DNA-binding transcriptional ArsR family regulator
VEDDPARTAPARRRDDVGEIAARFDDTWPTVTRHLRVLEQAELVEVVLRRRERLYRLQAGPLFAVGSSWIDRFRISS